MIIVKKRPYDRCMSGNPIMYELYSALAASNPEIYFEIGVWFAPAYDLSYTLLATFPVVPVAGTAQFDIKDFLDGKLEYKVPDLNANEKLATEAKDHTGLFYIEFREILTAGSDPSWNSTETDYKKFVMKGGLSYFKYRGDNFWENYFNDNNPFLTWRESGRLARTKDRMYLAFLNTLELPSWDVPEVVGPTLWSSCTCFYTDGTNEAAIYAEVTANAKDVINFIPAGAKQWGLPTIDPTKRIHRWEIQMHYTSAAIGTKTALNEPFVFYADNRNDYKNVLLQFRNSLGSTDPLLVRGVIEIHLNYTFDEQDRTVLADYFDGKLISPSRIIANAKEKVIYRGDAGLLAKEEQDRLRDMMMDRNAYWEIGGKWWPVNILTPSGKLTDSDKTEWPFPIEFSLAYDGDRYYTPPSVDLGDRTFKTNVCAAELEDITHDVDTSGPTATDEIMFVFPPGLLHYSYQIPGVHADPIVANTADLPLVIAGLALEQLFTIKLRPICSNGVIGRVFESAFNTIGDGGGSGSGHSMFLINETGATVDVETDGVNPYTFLAGINGDVFITGSGTITNNSGAPLKFKFLQSLPSVIVDEVTLNDGEDYNFPADPSFYNYVRVSVP